MKKQLFIAISVLLLSCTNRISEKEEDYIRSRITLHNDFLAFLGFLQDSLSNKIGRDSIHRTAGKNHKVMKLADSIASILYQDKNAPYDPDSDHQLTYLKFMHYCTEHRIDPVKEATRLRIK